MDSSKGFSRHAFAKEHLKCMALWKEKESRSAAGTEVSTHVNSRQLDRNRKYFSAIVDIIEFPYIHCFNHQLHLVVVRAMSSENAL